MSTLDNANYFRVFVIEVFVQYGEQQKVIVIDDTFQSTVKIAFKMTAQKRWPSKTMITSGASI